MTPPDLLKQAHPGEFVGEYTAPVPGSDARMPIADVYTGEIPGGDDATIYEFMPVPGSEIADVTDEPLAAASVGNIQRTEGGRIDAHLSLVVKDAERSTDAVARNPITEGEARFGRLFEALTREDGVDRLLMEPGDTNVPAASLHRLGFKAVEGSEMLQLDLPVDERPKAAA